jgi:hypothetical protein
MKTFLARGSSRLAGLLGSTGALGLLVTPMEAWAGPWNQPYGYPQPVDSRRVPYPVPTLPSASSYGDGYGGGYRADYDANRYRANLPVAPDYIQAQTAQRCNVGRLVGGIVGGGLGYAASRQEGRTWAVPLGALLGQQVGCSIGAQRAPLPW